MVGEFGRTPKINATAGRDHWPKVFSVVLAGGGIKKGFIYGSSDATASEPENDPLTVEDLVLGAPLSMEELDDARRLERFAGKYAHDGCQVIEVKKVTSSTLSGFGWAVRFIEEGSGRLVH